MSFFYNLLKIFLSLALFLFFGALCGFIWLLVFCSSPAETPKEQARFSENSPPASLEDFLSFLKNAEYDSEFEIKECDIPEFLNSIFVHCIRTESAEKPAEKSEENDKYKVEIFSFVVPPSIEVAGDNLLKVSSRSAYGFAGKSFIADTWIIFEVVKNPKTAPTMFSFVPRRAGIGRAEFPKFFAPNLASSFVNNYNESVAGLGKFFGEIKKLSFVRAHKNSIIFVK